VCPLGLGDGDGERLTAGAEHDFQQGHGAERVGHGQTAAPRAQPVNASTRAAGSTTIMRQCVTAILAPCPASSLLSGGRWAARRPGFGPRDAGPRGASRATEFGESHDRGDSDNRQNWETAVKTSLPATFYCAKIP